MNGHRPGTGTGAEDEIAGSGSTGRIPAQRAPLQLPLEHPSVAMPAEALDGLQRADEAGDPWWMAGCDQAIECLAGTGQQFSADDVRAQGVTEPAHPNAWGARFAVAHRRGVIEPVAVGRSARASRHGGLRRLWVGATTGPNAAPQELEV